MDTSGHFSAPVAVRREKQWLAHVKNGSEAQSVQSRVSEQKVPSQDLSEPFHGGRFRLNKLCLHCCGDFGAALLSLSTKCPVPCMGSRQGTASVY